MLCSALSCNRSTRPGWDVSEVLVVDGGSSDNTALLARKAGAKVDVRVLPASTQDCNTPFCNSCMKSGAVVTGWKGKADEHGLASRTRHLCHVSTCRLQASSQVTHDHLQFLISKPGLRSCLCRYRKLVHTAAQNCNSMTKLPPLWGCFETIDADVSACSSSWQL